MISQPIINQTIFWAFVIVFSIGIVAILELALFAVRRR